MGLQAALQQAIEVFSSGRKVSANEQRYVIIRSEKSDGFHGYNKETVVSATMFDAAPKLHYPDIGCMLSAIVIESPILKNYSGIQGGTGDG